MGTLVVRIRAAHRISRLASHIVILLLAGLSPVWAQTSSAIHAWRAIEHEASCADYLLFLEEYSDTKLAPMARNKLRKRCPQVGTADSSVEDSSGSSGTGIDDRRDEILGYLRDPREKPCPKLAAPVADDPLLKTVGEVCASEQAREQTSAAGPARLSELPELLTSLMQHYPIDAYGERIHAPYWIAQQLSKVDLDLGCVAGYNKHMSAYDAARSGLGSPEQQRASLLAAQDAVQPCREWLRDIGIDDKSITGALADIDRKIQDRQVRMTAQERLEEEIYAAVSSGIIPSENQLRDWQTRAKQVPMGVLPDAFENTLRALQRYHYCMRYISYDKSLTDFCKPVGVQTEPRPPGGRPVVFSDDRIARQKIGSYLTRGTELPSPRAGGPCNLYKAFTHLSEMTESPPREARFSFEFELPVRKTLTECGASLNCISTDTMALIQPHKGWVWTAFADCRLLEGRYKDAVENLDVAARYLRPNEEPELADLIIRRLQQVGDEASGAGARDFDIAGLRTKVGRKDSSVWLRDALTPGPRAPVPRPLIDTLSESIESPPATTLTSAPRPRSAGHVTGDPDDYWYAKHRGGTATLNYFNTLRTYAPDIRQVMTSVEQVYPELLTLMRYWDQVELDLGFAIGSAAVTGIVDRLRNTEPDRFDRVALDVTASKERNDLLQALGFYPADFAVRHAIARRAIELDCPNTAKEQLQSIGAEHLDAVGPAAARLHRIVLGYVNDRAGLPDACTNQ